MILEKWYILLTLVSTLTLGNQITIDDIDFNATKVPVLMYHHIVSSGECNDVTISEEKFNEQMRYLKDSGYNTVSKDELISYAESGDELPKKPVCITFDDGYLSNYEIAYPILRENNMKAIMFAIGSSVGKDTYKETDYKIIPHFNYEQALEMEESGLIDIESHTYDMHQAPQYENTDKVRENALKLENETEEEYIEVIRKDFELIQKDFLENLNKNITVMAFPHGAYDALATGTFRALGMKMTFSTERKVSNILKCIPESLYGIGRLNMSESTTMEELEGYLLDL